MGGRSSQEGTTILFGGGAKVCEIRVLNFYEIEVYSFEKNLGFTSSIKPLISSIIPWVYLVT